MSEEEKQSLISDELREEYKRRRRQRKKERRAAGLCPTCGKLPVFSGYSTCEPCLEKVRGKKRNNLENGMCSQCGKNPFIKNCEVCTQCREKQIKNREVYVYPQTEERKKRKADSNKRWQESERNPCNRCGKTKEKKSDYYCVDCREMNKLIWGHMQAILKENGICMTCEKVDAIPGQRSCVECTRKATELSRRKRRKSKIIVIEKYGGKCACCFESNYKFLCIDHVNNDGNIERKKSHAAGGNRWYTYLKNNPVRDDLQILCFNCNMAKQFYGECPHQEDKRLADQEKEKPLA